MYKDIYGGYYHVGAFDSCFTQDPSDAENFPEYIAHLNEDFEIDWLRNLGTWDGHKYIWHVEQLSDGNFQLSGANAVNLDPRFKGWAARVDHNGWTIWDNDYTCDEDYSSYLVDFDVRQDGSLILVGAARNDTVPQWRGQELWLVSVDSNGCLIPGCSPTIVKPLKQKKEEELLVYPNPTTGEFMADAKDEGSGVISDLQGREIDRFHILKGKNEMSLPVGLASGVYLLQYRTAHGHVNVRLIKE